MHISRSPWQSHGEEGQSKALQSTKERIEKQLAAVIQLTEYNAEYLEPFEVNWIDHIISSALGTVVKETIPDLDLLQPERAAARQSWRHGRLSTGVSRWRHRQSLPGTAQDQLALLLSTAKALNSATSLLSCCYDRWCWMKSSKALRNDSDQTTSDLKDFLNWRRKLSGGGRPSFAEPRQTPQDPIINASDATNAGHTYVPLNPDSHTLLSLLADTTTEKWRQNAEDALDATMERLRQDTTNNNQTRRRSVRSDLDMNHLHSPPVVSRVAAAPLSRSTQWCESTQFDDGLINDYSTHSEPTGASSPRLQCPVHHRAIGRPCACAMNHFKRNTNGSDLSTASFSSLSLSNSPPPSEVRTAPFQRSLQNSYDKESLTVQSSAHLNQSRSTETVQSLRTIHDHNQTLKAPSFDPMASRTTLTNASTSPEASSASTSASNTSASVVFSHSVNPSLVSLPGSFIETRTAQRSRGRRWLEQQLEVDEGLQVVRRKHEYS